MSRPVDKRELLMREVNERIYEILEEDGSEDGDFLCECGDEDCDETIQITLREYAALRKSSPPGALRSPGHLAVTA